MPSPEQRALHGTIIRDVTVVDGTATRPRAHQDVRIVNGVFTATDMAGRLPGDGAVEVDGRGRWLIPGLWESHTHLRGDPALGIDGNVARLEALMADYLAEGITAVVELGGSAAVDAAVREQRARGTLRPGADVYFAGPSVTGIDGWPLPLHHNRELIREVGAIAHVEHAIATIVGGGADVVKIIYDSEPGAPDRIPPDALRETVALAHDHGLRVMVHVHCVADTYEALAAGADGIEHAVVAGPHPLEDGKRLADAFARAGALFCPTLTIFEQIGRDGEEAYLDELVAAGITTPAERAALLAPGSRFGSKNFPHHPWEEALDRTAAGLAILPLMQAAGVPIAAGSDVAVVMARPKALHREMQLLERGGLSPHEVLIAATSASAMKIARAESGSIAVGKRADALLLDADPCERLDHILDARHRVATFRNGAQIS